MRIQHNISAINSWRQLGINQSNASKNLEKLSSGYRINRAGDDAAGLAISEKMRAQIRGLDMATKNAQDGVSLIQTAEGALNETHAILQRMRELAVQSANGTYQDTDRENTDLEIEALKSELDRIAQSTTFNKIQLLDGSKAKDYRASQSTAMNFNINAAFAEGESITIGDKTFTFGGENGIAGDTVAEQAKNLADAINEAGIDDVRAEANGKMIKLTSISGHTFTTPTTAGKMSTNQDITVAAPQANGNSVSYTLAAKTDADGMDKANFKAGDTFTAADGNTYTFGSGAGQVAVGESFDASMANLTAALNGQNAGLPYNAGNGKTDVAAGSWTYENQTNTLTFVANDQTQDFAAHAPNQAISLQTMAGVTGGITTDKGESTARLDTSGYQISADQLKAGADFYIGKERYHISDDTELSARLNDLVSQINANDDALVRAEVVDNQLQLSTKEAGSIGEVKIVTDNSPAVAEVTITTKLAAGDKITVDGHTYTAHDLGINSADTAETQMQALTNLINGQKDRHVVATYTAGENGQAGKVTLESAVPGNVTIEPAVLKTGVITIENKTATETQSGEPTKAAAAFDMSGFDTSKAFKAGETLEVNGQRVTFVTNTTTAGNKANQVQVGSNFKATMDNLAAHLNASGDSTSSTNSTIGVVKESTNGAAATDISNGSGSWRYDAAAKALKFEAAAANADQVISNGADLGIGAYHGKMITSFPSEQIMVAATEGTAAAKGSVTVTFEDTQSGGGNVNTQFADGEKITFGTKELTFVTAASATGADNEVLLGENLASTLNNVVDWLNTNDATLGGQAGAWNFNSQIPGGTTDSLQLTWTAAGVGVTTGLAALDGTTGTALSYTGVDFEQPGVPFSGDAAVTIVDGATPQETVEFDFTQQLANGANFNVGDKLTINGTEYDFVAAGAAGAQIEVGDDLAATLNNMAIALNTNTGANALAGADTTGAAGNVTVTWQAADGKLIAQADTAGETIDEGQLSISNYIANPNRTNGNIAHRTIQNGSAGDITTIARDKWLDNDIPEAAEAPSDLNEMDLSGNGLTFQIGANGTADQRVTLYIKDMSTKGLNVAGVSVATQPQANDAIDIIDSAVDYVSKTRAELGALQNRLEHTINNLGVNSENLSAAESRIRDVDMAKEMMAFTKNNILTQAAQAMLAQANQQPQGVLQLLQ